MVLHIDMDELISNFVDSALSVHGWERWQLEEKREPGVWDMHIPMGLTPNKFWRPINARGQEFWINLKPLPWAEDLVALVKSLGVEWYVITAPGLAHSSYLGKLKWIQKFFGRKFNNFVITPHKHLFANPQSVLIDDRPENINKFRRYGGEGILFPYHGNALFHYAQDPLPHVKTWLPKLLGKEIPNVVPAYSST